MSEKFRGNSPSQRKKVITKEAQEASARAEKAFLKRNQKKVSIMDQYGYHIVIGGFLVLVLAAFANTFFSKSRNPEVTPVIENDEIASHNSSGYSFKLGSNDHFDGWMLSDTKQHLSTYISSKQNIAPCPSAQSVSIIPESYNFREAYPTCVGDVYASNKCAASYAISSASTVADRLCRNHPENQYVRLSPQPLIDCDDTYSQKCSGGYVSRGFDYARIKGLPEETCFNYTGSESASCEELTSCETHKIVDQCVVSTEEQIKREIHENGPVVVVIPIYRDFLVYKEGVYSVLQGVSPFQAGQAIKVLGWDKDSNGKNYWIVENSWGESWGENGLARIYVNESQLVFENAALAPVVSVPETAEEPAAQN